MINYDLDHLDLDYKVKSNIIDRCWRFHPLSAPLICIHRLSPLAILHIICYRFAKTGERFVELFHSMADSVREILSLRINFVNPESIWFMSSDMRSEDRKVETLLVSDCE